MGAMQLVLRETYHQTGLANIGSAQMQVAGHSLDEMRHQIDITGQSLDDITGRELEPTYFKLRCIKSKNVHYLERYESKDDTSPVSDLHIYEGKIYTREAEHHQLFVLSGPDAEGLAKDIEGISDYHRLSQSKVTWSLLLQFEDNDARSTWRAALKALGIKIKVIKSTKVN